MAKKKENAEMSEAEAQEAKAEKKAAAKRERTAARMSTRVYVSNKTTRPGQVFNFLQTAVIEQGAKVNGDSVPSLSWEELLNYTLENYTPRKSLNYGPQYVNAYIRGGISEGWLTTDPEKALSEVPLAPEREKSAKKSGPSEAGLALLSAMKSIVETKDYEAGNFTVTLADLSEAAKKDVKVIGRTIKKLVKDGFVEATTDDESKTDYYRFTATGWDAVA